MTVSTNSRVVHDFEIAAYTHAREKLRQARRSSNLAVAYGGYLRTFRRCGSEVRIAANIAKLPGLLER